MLRARPERVESHFQTMDSCMPFFHATLLAWIRAYFSLGLSIMFGMGRTNAKIF